MRSPRSFETLAGGGDGSSSYVTANIQSVDDSANQRTDRNRLVFVEVNRSGFAVGFEFFNHHGRNCDAAGGKSLAR